MAWTKNESEKILSWMMKNLVSLEKMLCGGTLESALESFCNRGMGEVLHMTIGTPFCPDCPDEMISVGHFLLALT